MSIPNPNSHCKVREAELELSLAAVKGTLLSTPVHKEWKSPENEGKQKQLKMLMLFLKGEIAYMKTLSSSASHYKEMQDHNIVAFFS